MILAPPRRARPFDAGSPPGDQGGIGVEERDLSPGIDLVPAVRRPLSSRPMTIPEQLANKDLSADVLEPIAQPPDRARVVIVGGGIIGSSIAYHLTKLG